MGRLTGLLLCLVAMAPVRADSVTLYKWVDEAGTTHFTSEPPPQRGSRMTLRYEGGRAGAVAPPATDRCFGDPLITLYSTEWCGVCRRAKAYLDGQGIRYREYDVETTRTGRRAYRKMGAPGVPVIDVDGRRMVGFSTERFEHLTGHLQDDPCFRR